MADLRAAIVGVAAPSPIITVLNAAQKAYDSLPPEAQEAIAAIMDEITTPVEVDL